jgi:hypothetical protein
VVLNTAIVLYTIFLLSCNVSNREVIEKRLKSLRGGERKERRAAQR